MCVYIYIYIHELGSTQLLTERSTRVYPGGKGGRCVRLTTLPPSCAVVTKSGNLNFLEPSEPDQACNGTALYIYICVCVCVCVCVCKHETSPSTLQDIKAYRGNREIVSLILVIAVFGGQLSASHLGCFTSVQQPTVHIVGLQSRAIYFREEVFLCLCWESNPRSFIT